MRKGSCLAVELVKDLKNHWLQVVVGFMFCGLGIPLCWATTTEKPNIVFILIDDLGWMDLACQGNTLVETPHLDRLAEQGMRFTNAYAAAPVCSPTRAAILTGQAPARLRITNHIPDHPRFTPPDAQLASAEMKDRLNLDYVTIAEHLQEGGYRTAFLGKWHLAGRGDAAFYPEHQGFELNIGGCAFGGPPTFFDPYRIPTLENRRAGEYLPDRLAAEAIRFMRSDRQQPFVLFLWNYTVHWPMEAPEALLEKYAERTGPGLNDTRYGAMIEAMDSSIGRVIAEVDALGIAENTLIVFTSDNGGFGGVADNRPLREAKGHLYEGGIRVPLIVRQPGTIEAGSECAAPTISMDFFPTLLETAALLPDPEVPLDGESLWPLLSQEGKLKRDAIYFHYPNYAWHQSNRLGSAIRAGDYKLIERFDDRSLELYNLSEDLSERHNLANSLTEKASEMQQRLAAWRAETNAAMPTVRN